MLYVVSRGGGFADADCTRCNIGADGMTTERLVRRDALPEHTDYKVSGCDLHNNCLTCPFAKCRFDIEGGKRIIMHDEMIARIRELKARNYTVERIARNLGISRRTVFRRLTRANA